MEKRTNFCSTYKDEIWNPARERYKKRFKRGVSDLSKGEKGEWRFKALKPMIKISNFKILETAMSFVSHNPDKNQQ